MDAGLDDDLLLGIGGQLGQLQRVTDRVAHAVEDLRCHVVVRQDHGVALGLETQDRVDQRRMQRPLCLGHDVGDPLVEVCGSRLDLR